MQDVFIFMQLNGIKKFITDQCPEETIEITREEIDDAMADMIKASEHFEATGDTSKLHEWFEEYS